MYRPSRDVDVRRPGNANSRGNSSPIGTNPADAPGRIDQSLEDIARGGIIKMGRSGGREGAVEGVVRRARHVF